MDINFQFTKKRSDFGRQPMFCEAGPVLSDNIQPDANEYDSYVLRNPVHQPTQHTLPVSAREINTIKAGEIRVATSHIEGGWPKEVNCLDPDQTQRYRRKFLREDNSYFRCIQNFAPDLEHYVLQNNAIDMYKSYYSEMEPVEVQERHSCRTVNVYRDPMVHKRRISSICWEPEGGRRFAVAYNDVTFERISRGKLESCIWDVENPMSPETLLKPPSPIVDLQYNPLNNNVLAGALLNGQVCWWDRRTGHKVDNLCAPHIAHRDVVRNVVFLNAKSGQEFISGSSDGVLKWWDMRNMNSVTDQMIMDRVQSASEVPSMVNAHGVSVVEYEPTIPSRFLVGTETGLVIGGNRKGKTAAERLPLKFDAHYGPVWSLVRNPGFVKNFLTVGDWTARIWSEDCRDSAVLWSPPLRHKVTAGAWSPTRPSLLLLSSDEGGLSVWDLLRRQDAPIVAMHVCSEPLLRVAVHEAGAMVACGSKKGSIYMVEMSNGLVYVDKNDKVLLTEVLEREWLREHNLETKRREKRLRLRQAKERKGRGKAGGKALGATSGAALAASSATVTTTSMMEMDATLGDRDLEAAAADYAQQIKKELLAMAY